MTLSIQFDLYLTAQKQLLIHCDAFDIFDLLILKLRQANTQMISFGGDGPQKVKLLKMAKLTGQFVPNFVDKFDLCDKDLFLIVDS